MPCSLYGKLPSKRDFVVIGATRDFLNAWEPWLQASVSSSRNQLGAHWQSAFLTAPIWRFWLGAEICGRSTLGALMSSLDGVGRYFPLTLFASADDGAAIAPPELDDHEAWFDAAETVLMSALDQDGDFETFSARVAALPFPQQRRRERDDPDLVPGTAIGIARLSGAEPLAALFASLRTREHEQVYAAASFWWTIGGENFAPLALCGRGLPDPGVFAAMLTGEFDKQPG
jgi:type VI secretion system protein ImpM